jgi:hypothetical protein
VALTVATDHDEILRQCGQFTLRQVQTLRWRGIRESRLPTRKRPASRSSGGAWGRGGVVPVIRTMLAATMSHGPEMAAAVQTARCSGSGAGEGAFGAGRMALGSKPRAPNPRRGVATRPKRSARAVNDKAPVTFDEGLELPDRNGFKPSNPGRRRGSGRPFSG